MNEAPQFHIVGDGKLGVSVNGASLRGIEFGRILVVLNEDAALRAELAAALARQIAKEGGPD